MQSISILSRLIFIRTWLTRRRLLSASMAFLIGSSVLVPLVQVPVRAQLAAPTPLTPTDGLTTTVDNHPPLGIPEFTWTAVEGATTYRIEISNNVGFTTLAYNANTPHTSHIPPTIGNLSDGTWYWHVRVESPSPPGDYSATMEFTKQWASPGNLPTLTSPADSTTLDFFDKPNFSWDPVMGAADYRFQIATSYDGFNTPVYNQTTLACTHQPTTKLANGDYYWRVVPRSPNSNDGTPSAVRAFTVSYNDPPTLLEPANNSFPTFTPTFRWTAMRGAQYYRLQYTTDPTFDTGVTQVDTRNTTYTPLNALPNDVNYYWRVRTHSGNSITDWSSSWSFLKQWYTQTKLLAPTNLYQYTGPPVFSWTPVPGAGRYKIEVDNDPGFTSLAWSRTTANTSHVEPSFNPDPTTGIDWWYWRVTPIDGSNNNGKESTSSSFVGQWFPVSPQPIYPLYYYSSEEANLEHLELLQPREDRMVAVPIFMWHRVFVSTGDITQTVPAYRIQVDDDYAFSSPDWTFETENLSAVPTADAPFTPDANTDYYWRVRPLDGLGGAEIGQWSQKWKTRINTTTGLSATVGSAPTLLRPPHASESVDVTPLLEWWPLQGTDSYEVQISTDSGFDPSYIVDTATVPYPAYTPLTRQTYYGTYYWRVRGISGGSPGAWSTSWRFQIAAQSHWKESRIVGYNQSLIGSDLAGDMTNSNYDVTTLYAAQDKLSWYFGFDAITDTTDMVYVLYLDLDHEDGSGATSDARGYNVNTISAHRPEYAIYVEQNSGSFSASDTLIYSWNGSAWDVIYHDLDTIGGALYYTSTTNYLEIEVPNTAIGMEETTGSAAVSLFSAMSGSGHAQDTVPSDPNVDYTTPDSGSETTTLSRFASVSERLNLLLPPTNATGDPTTYPSVLPFYWHLPVDASWYGYHLQVALDEEFTSGWKPEYTLIGPGHSHYTYHDYRDLAGDNTYYWRVRPKYAAAGNPEGAWSEPGRFERLGFVAQNLQTSVSFATPTFSWDMPEGADSYDIQVDDDPGFGSPAISKETRQTSYTPESTLAKGTYYWRVRVRRYGSIINDWTYTQTFTLNLPQPAGLSHDPVGAADRAPTLCWTPLITPSSGIPLLAAYKYRVEVSRGDPTFSSLYDNVETEQSCWTPQKGYDDGTYYWHVAIRDGQNRLGDYSEAITFTKQYPVTTLISPTTGSQLAGTPTFVWTPVDGASSYRLEVSKYQNFGVPYDSVTTNNTRYTPQKEYDEATYYWRVAIIDKNNKYGPYNTAEIILSPYPYSIFLPTVVRDS